MLLDTFGICSVLALLEDEAVRETVESALGGLGPEEVGFGALPNALGQFVTVPPQSLPLSEEVKVLEVVKVLLGVRQRPFGSRSILFATAILGKGLLLAGGVFLLLRLPTVGHEGP